MASTPTGKELFFSFFRLGLTAYGGPAMVAHIRELALNRHQWLDDKEFRNGLALGQVTPGPIIITATFVGYMVQGLTGAVIATIAIFTPSFLLVVAVAPIFDRLRSSPYFGRITDGILASFVGLLLFVLIKFATAVPWDLLRIIIGL